MDQQTRKLLAFLEKNRISIPEYVMLHLISPAVMTKEQVIQKAVWMYDPHRYLKVSSEECESAIDMLYGRLWIRLLDEEIIAEINAECVSEGIRPLEETGPSGCLDVTRKGVEAHLDILNAALGMGRETFWHDKTKKIAEATYRLTILGTDLDVVEYILNKHLGRNASAIDPSIRERVQGKKTLISSKGPDAIGEFRDYWWRTPTKGFRLEATYSIIFPNGAK